jgi:hypothetical protein
MFIDFAGDTCLNQRLRNRYAFRRQFVGDARLGFPLNETLRTYNKRGISSTTTQEVVELSTDRLDDALFSVPAGYTLYEPRARGKPSTLSRALSIFR